MPAWSAGTRGPGCHGAVGCSGTGRCFHAGEAASAPPLGRKSGRASHSTGRAACPCHPCLTLYDRRHGGLLGAHVDCCQFDCAQRDRGGMMRFAGTMRGWGLTLVALLALAAALSTFIPPRVTIRGATTSALPRLERRYRLQDSWTKARHGGTSCSIGRKRRGRRVLPTRVISIARRRRPSGKSA